MLETLFFMNVHPFSNSLKMIGDIEDRLPVSEITERTGDRKKQPFIRKLFTMGERNGKKMSKSCSDSLEAEPDPSNEISHFSSEEPPMTSGQHIQNLRVFVATWNVGGKCPHGGLHLDEFLQISNESDMYVLGFQEIVPLNAGNVLVLEDNEPAAKWLALINQSLNKSAEVAPRKGKPSSPFSGSFFSKPSLKKISKTFRTESRRKLKSCNCAVELERKVSKEFCFGCQESSSIQSDSSSEEDEEFSIAPATNQMKYSLVASKQMVGIFVCIWMRKELVQHVGHLRISCISRGIMGCLGNKGCISVSMSLYQTSFCFICSHLASGEKEGDELRRNLDVIEILKGTQFPRMCRTPYSRIPEKILGHNRIIWFGDLNYRIALSYSETKKLLEENNWDVLLHKDQLKIEREAGRVFKGWREGKIYFAPTYKYSFNSDSYYTEAMKNSKTKRRTPAWCDRILWHGSGIRQLSYIRGESRFSDHRPVCATFLVDVEVASGGLTKKLSNSNIKIAIEELLPTSTSTFLSRNNF